MNLNPAVQVVGDRLETRFLNGDVIKRYTLDDLRKTVNKYDNFKELTA
jgi:autonomous glycyl radical cofactor GrcA